MTNEYPTEYPAGTPGPFEEPVFEEPQVAVEPPVSVEPPLSGDQQTEESGMSAAASTAQDRAAELKDQAAESGRHVVETAKDEAANVVQEAKAQTRDLLAQAREELQAQAREQQQRVADGLTAVSEQFGQMAAATDAEGTAVDLVRQAADRSRSMADWIGQRDPGSVVGELREFARRRPGVFIAAAATAGILIGRFTRAAAEGEPDAEPGGRDD